VGVGVAKSSNSLVVSAVVLMVLRVSVPRCSRSSRNPRTSSPSPLTLRAAFLAAPAERTAGATGLVRVGDASSVKLKGASASRRCQTRTDGFAQLKRRNFGLDERVTLR